jgi:GDP-L-fucose synthase
MKLLKSEINKYSKIFLFGHNGLIGSAILKTLRKKGYKNIKVFEKKYINLLDQKKVKFIFKKYEPDAVIMAAARVGGILANKKFPYNFIYENLTIQNNIIHNSVLFGVKKLIFLGSSCIYPKTWTKPFAEKNLTLSGLEKSNEPYAIAKIAGLHLCNSYNRQFYQKIPKFITLIPPNLFGPNDNYNQENSHVLAALLRKFFLAKSLKKNFVKIWGSGNPKREFMYSEDAAKIIVKFLEISDKVLFSYTKGEFSHFNIGCGKDYSIAQIASIIKKISCFKGRLKYNNKYPDGVYRKLLDSSMLLKIFPDIKQMNLTNKFLFEKKIKKTYKNLTAEILKKFDKNNSSYNLPN